jgi:HemY protein
MRTTLWLVALFAIAVAAALFAGNNNGTVTLYWPPFRVDVSLNLVALGLALLFLALHLALRAMSALLNIPHEARRWRMLGKERAMHAAFVDALFNLTAGRFVRARRAAELAITMEESLEAHRAKTAHSQRVRTMAHMVAAESAHALQDRSRREQHFERLQELPPTREGQEGREGALLRAARWALDDRDASKALEWLDQMPSGVARRTVAQRLRLRAARLAGRSQQALDAVRQLTKHRAFSEVVGAGIARGLALEMLRAAHDPSQLQRAWSALDATEQKVPDVALEAAERCLLLGGEASTSRQWLLPLWERLPSRNEGLADAQRIRMVRILERGFSEASGTPDAVWLTRVEALQQANPADPLFQYLAGILCTRLELWGKAQQLLRQSLTMLKDPEMQRDAWRALAELAERRQDLAAAAQAYKQAAKA